MKRTKVSSFWASVLIFTLVISLFTPFREVSASGNTIEDASILENGKEQTGMLKEPEQSQWYQISPGKDEIFNDSHMALSVKSESFLNVSVYASKEKAQKTKPLICTALILRKKKKVKSTFLMPGRGLTT